MRKTGSDRVFILDRAGWALTRVSLRGLFLYNTGMTAQEKKDVAFFTDLASSLIGGGYFQGGREYSFQDDDNDSDSEDSWSAIGGPEERAPGAHRAPDPMVMVIGDVSGSGEEALLLDKMLGAIGLSRESNCLITNLGEYEGRLRSMKPGFILCLGEQASRALLHSAEPVEKLRGKFFNYEAAGAAIPLIATYHPGDLLRNGEYKRPCWDDLKMLRAAIAPAEAE